METYLAELILQYDLPLINNDSKLQRVSCGYRFNQLSNLLISLNLPAICFVGCNPFFYMVLFSGGNMI